MAGEARYSVGIDLGTTNSAMACADLTGEDATAIEVLAIPQLVNAGELSEGSLLPSFLYVAGEFDFPADSLRLPWPNDADRRWVVGELARSHFVDVGDVELSDLHGRQCNDGVSRARDASLRHPAAYRSADRRPTDRSGMMRR